MPEDTQTGFMIIYEDRSRCPVAIDPSRDQGGQLRWLGSHET